MAKKRWLVNLIIGCFILILAGSGCVFAMRKIFIADDIFRSERVSCSYNREDFHFTLSDEKDLRIQELIEQTKGKESMFLFFFREISSADFSGVRFSGTRHRLKELIDGREYQDEEEYNGDYIGQWSFTYDIGNMVAEEIGVKNKKVKFPVKVIVDIRTDGTIEAYADKNSISDGVDIFIDSSMDAIYQVVKDMGYTKSEADLFIGLVYGGKWKNFIMEEYGQMINREIEASHLSLEYDIDKNFNNRIYVWKKGGRKDKNNYGVYDIDGNNMKLTTIPKEFYEMLPDISAPINMEK